MSSRLVHTADRSAGLPASPEPRAPVLLVAVVTLLALESVRASGPLLDSLVADSGLIMAAVAAVLGYAAPALIGVLVWSVDARRATVVGVVALAVLRLLAQAMTTPSLAVGTAAAAVALGVLVLVVRQAAGAPRGAVPTVTGLVLGSAVDVALRALLMTWDLVWRPGLIAWLVVLAQCAALVWAVVAARPRLRRDPHPVGRVGVVGGCLALWLLILGSPAFLASASGLSLAYAAAVLLVGGLFAVEALSRSALPGGSGRWPDLSGRYAGGIAAGLLAASVAAALLTTGIVVVAAVLVGQVAAALVLARALSPATASEMASLDPSDWELDPAEQRAADKLDAPENVAGEELHDTLDRELTLLARRRRPRPRSAAGHGLAGLAAGLGYVLVTLLYQVHYELPLPFPNWLIPVAAAVLLGLLGLGERPVLPLSTAGGDERAAKRGRLAPLAALPAVLLLAPVALLATAPPPNAETGASNAETGAPKAAEAGGGTFRMLTWNLHYAANGAGAVDPATIAATIAAQRPDVVLLQEVSRGWPIGGGLDGAEWLSRRLAMPYVWAPAADGQFGNLILSRLRIVDGKAGQLPQGESSMDRSYAMAVVELANGRAARLIDVHLAHRDADTATRIEQLATLLDAAGKDPSVPTVLAGDFNAGPGSEEIKQLTGSGMVSAQDNTGHGDLLTSPTDRPQRRVDWIFGTADVHFEDFVRPKVRASDHFPLAVTVRVG